MVHHTQLERLERIRQVKKLLQEALANSPDKRLTRRVSREVENEAMIQLGCSERRAKEYVKIARIQLEANS